jgi:hypothetical protein
MQDAGYRYRVPAPGTGYRIPDTQYLTRSDAEDPTPSTEDRAWGPGNGKRAHRVYTMQDRKGSDPGYPVPGTCLRKTRTPSMHPVSIRTPCAGFSRTGTRYRVPAIWHLGPGTRHRSRIDAEDRTPSTEDRARPPENAHTGYTCIQRSNTAVRQYGQ